MLGEVDGRAEGVNEGRPRENVSLDKLSTVRVLSCESQDYRVSKEGTLTVLQKLNE